VAGCCECGDESSGSCATELVIITFTTYGSIRLVLARAQGQYTLNTVLKLFEVPGKPENLTSQPISTA
jgi:hypothetical protein